MARNSVEPPGSSKSEAFRGRVGRQRQHSRADGHLFLGDVPREEDWNRDDGRPWPTPKHLESTYHCVEDAAVRFEQTNRVANLNRGRAWLTTHTRRQDASPTGYLEDVFDDEQKDWLQGGLFSSWQGSSASPREPLNGDYGVDALH